MEKISSLKNLNEEYFRLYLQQELSERIKKNSRFSLRAFAKYLEIDCSQLSRILRGERKASLSTVNRTLEILRPAPEVVSGLVKEKTASSLKFDMVSVETFKIIADWYHFAILELTRVEGFKSDNKWIADKLGISVNEANIAIERLMRFEYLELENGIYKDISGLLSTEGNPFTTSAFRQLQKQVLQQAINALDDVPFEKRMQTSLTFAISEQDFVFIKEKINKTKEEIIDFVERDHAREKVYQLSFSLFPVTNEI